MSMIGGRPKNRITLIALIQTIILQSSCLRGRGFGGALLLLRAFPHRRVCGTILFRDLLTLAWVSPPPQPSP